MILRLTEFFQRFSTAPGQFISRLKADATHASLFPKCHALVNRTQGENIIALDYYSQCISDPDQLLVLALLAGEVVGVASARRLPPDGSAFLVPGNAGKEIRLSRRDSRLSALSKPA